MKIVGDTLSFCYFEAEKEKEIIIIFFLIQKCKDD